MGKYLLEYVRPAKSGKRVVDSETPELAVKQLYDEYKKNGKQIEEIHVTDLQDDEAEPREVLGMCMFCSLPIWIDEEDPSAGYGVAGDESFYHDACNKDDRS